MERCEAERGKSPEAHRLASLAYQTANKAEGENSPLRLSAELHMRMVAQMHLHKHTEIYKKNREIGWLIFKGNIQTSNLSLKDPDVLSRRSITLTSVSEENNHRKVTIMKVEAT